MVYIKMGLDKAAVFSSLVPPLSLFSFECLENPHCFILLSTSFSNSQPKSVKSLETFSFKSTYPNKQKLQDSKEATRSAIFNRTKSKKDACSVVPCLFTRKQRRQTQESQRTTRVSLGYLNKRNSADSNERQIEPETA